jgi:hypothetical protein
MTRKTVTAAVSVWGQCLTSFGGYPGWRLPAAFEKEGFEIVALGDATAECYVALEHDSTNLRSCSRSVSVACKILIALEPAAVTPAQHTDRIRKKYGLTIVQSPLQVGKSASMAVTMGYLPAPAILKDLRMRAGSVEVADAEAIGIINENKFSFVRSNRYSTRRRLIRQLAARGRHINLAGRNWDNSWMWMMDKQARAFLHCTFSLSWPNLRHLNLRSIKSIRNVNLFGRVDSEIDFLAGQVFNLVVENDPNYVSEKLFNAVISGSVPIYIGPPLPTFGIPSAIALTVDSNISGESLDTLISELTQDDIRQIRKAGARWLDSQETQKKWNHDASFEAIVHTIRKHLDLQFDKTFGETNC